MGSIVCQRTFPGCALSWDLKSDYSRTRHIFKPISFLASSLCWQARGPWGSSSGRWGIFSHCALIFFSPICNLTCHLFWYYLADPRNWRWRATSSTGARSRISQFPVIRVKRRLTGHQLTKWILEVQPCRICFTPQMQQCGCFNRVIFSSIGLTCDSLLRRLWGNSRC